jgi:gentisate 1,2-dioxygenase
MVDKHGTEIKAGDTLFNPYDRDQYHEVIAGGDGTLFLGDLDSPLERYAPQEWWEIISKPNAPHQARAVASRPECGCSTIGGTQ